MKIRIVITILSVLFLIVLGALGDSLINTITVAIKFHDVACPNPTALALSLFDVNGCDFLLSMTPFMILFIGIALLIRKDKRGALDYLYVFIILWLLVMIYFTTFVWALSLPFFPLYKPVDTNPIRILIYILDFIIIAGVVFLFIRKVRKQNDTGNIKDEQT